MTEEVSDIKYSEVPFYFLDTEKTGDLNVFFIGDSDVPYVSLADWTEILTMVMKVAYMDMGLSFRLKYTPEGQTGILTREDNYTMVVDCEKDTITFLDYDAFLRPEENRNLVDMLTAADSMDEKPTLFQRIAEFSYDRYGKELVLEAGKYGIDLVMAQNVCMVPLMTLVDFTISGQGMIASYTKDKVIIATSSQLEDENNQITAMGELFRSGEQGPVSTAAADYNYAELCMVFDYMYGLKDAHGFTSFDALVDELGLRDALKNTEPEVSDVALWKLIAQDLDDQHSAVSMLSPSVFKNSHRVTLIGDTSGGGSCVVLPLASLVGTVFQISSPFRISFSKNGSFYDTDLGVEPDFPIVNEVFLYDRPALTEYINNLK